MAVTRGTNAGFVTAAPSADPGGSEVEISGFSWATKDASPAGNNKVTALGWHQTRADNEALAYGCGIYSHDAVNDRPNTLIDTQTSGQSTTANTPGWYSYTGLNISLTASTTYWVAATCATEASKNNSVDSTVNAAERAARVTATPLPSPWSGTSEYGRVVAIYAVYEAAGGGPLSNPFSRPFHGAFRRAM